MILLIIGCLFLQFDLELLKKRAASVFVDVFRFPLGQTIVFAMLLFLAVLKSNNDGAVILEIISCMLLLIYLVRRSEFFALVKGSPDYAPLQDENLQLALWVLRIVFFWALGMIVVSVLAECGAQVFHWPIDDLAALLISSEISSVLMVVLIYQAVRACKGLKLFAVLGLETKGLSWIKVWVLPFIFALGYAIVTSSLLEARPIKPFTPLADILNSTSSLWVLLFFAGTAILTAPFFEEIVFRGFFFSVFERFKGKVFAVIFVALTFGVLHVDQYWGDWEAILVVGLFGLSLTLLRAWSGSALPGMIAHYVYNTSLIVLPVLTVLFSNPIYLDYQVNYYRLTDVQKEQCLLKSIEKYPQFSNSYNDLAWLYSEQGIKLDSALEFIDKALNFEPDNFAFLDTKAQVLFKMGRCQEAIAIEKDLIKKYPKDDYLRQQLKKFEDG